MEPGEDIEEAVRREVKEETGLDFDPTTLLQVESAGKLKNQASNPVISSKELRQNAIHLIFNRPGGLWYRFVMTGEVTGGRLKTPADADAESLQAKWIKDLGELSLRSNDVILMVERGRQYASRRSDEPWHPTLVRSQ